VRDGLGVAATRAGYGALRRWAARGRDRRWAIENAAGLGRTRAQWLLGDDETVVDVPAKLSARVRLLSTGHGRKTDPADAVSTALAACGPTPLQVAALDARATTLRLLSDRRDDLVARRTNLRPPLPGWRALLAQELPPPHLPAEQAAVLLRRVRPTEGPGQTRRRLAKELIREVRHLDAAIRASETQIATAIRASHT